MSNFPYFFFFSKILNPRFFEKKNDTGCEWRHTIFIAKKIKIEKKKKKKKSTKSFLIKSMVKSYFVFSIEYTHNSTNTLVTSGSNETQYLKQKIKKQKQQTNKQTKRVKNPTYWIQKIRWED